MSKREPVPPQDVELSGPSGSESALRARPLPDGSTPLVLVLGATGYIGGRLVPRLLAAGYRVRVLTRSRGRLAALPWADDVDIVTGDAGDPDAMETAMTGVHIVYFLVHSMTSGRDYGKLDRAIALNVAMRAAEHKVGRIIYLGGLHPDGVELSDHLASRKEVGDILLASATPTIVLQAGVVIGSGSASFEMIRHLTEVLPYMPAPRWVRNSIQPIAVRDVVYYLLARSSRSTQSESGVRHRRPRRIPLLEDDERLRRRGGSPPAQDHGATRPDPRACVPLGGPRHARASADCAASR